MYYHLQVGTMESPTDSRELLLGGLASINLIGSYYTYIYSWRITRWPALYS